MLRHSSRLVRGAALLGLASMGVAAIAPGQSHVPPRQVAITFDDLPVATSLHRSDVAAQRRITTALVAAIRANGVPAIGFVNEDKLLDGRDADPSRIALLRQWLDAGLELGNHSYSHPDLHRTPIGDYEADVLAGEQVTRPLSSAAGRPFRFFRHPFLHTGRDLETKVRFERFLAGHGYRVAPVTIDNYDYLFAAAYERSLARRDSALASRVRAEYLRYMERVFAYYEQQSVALVGREIAQTLLLHANQLNGDAFADLARMIRSRGYAFVPLERALDDSAYASEDRYTGPAGITWLHRWALTAGKRGAVFAGEPEVPAFVTQAAQQ